MDPFYSLFFFPLVFLIPVELLSFNNICDEKIQGLTSTFTVKGIFCGQNASLLFSDIVSKEPRAFYATCWYWPGPLDCLDFIKHPPYQGQIQNIQKEGAEEIVARAQAPQPRFHPYEKFTFMKMLFYIILGECQTSSTASTRRQPIWRCSKVLNHTGPAGDASHLD